MSLNFKVGRMYKCTGGAIWKVEGMQYGEVDMRLVRRGRDSLTVIGGDATMNNGIRTFDSSDGAHYADTNYKILHEVVP